MMKKDHPSEREGDQTKRGLGNRNKAKAIKDLMKMEPIDVLMLQETKIEGETLLNSSTSKWKFDSGKVISARGSAGGIGTFWSKNLFTLGKTHKTQHWIYTKLWHTTGKVKLDLFNMYVSVHYEEKNECWKTLIEYIEQCSPTNIIIGGDMNIILDPKEKQGGSYTRDPFLLTVENLIQSWDLVDFKLVKGTYTWTNNKTGEQHISARLDRFLASSAIMMDNRMVLSKILPKLTSDNKPILLHIKEEEDLGPLSFRFIPLWAKREGFLDTVQTTWEIEISGSPSYVSKKKIKNTKKSLKEWIKKEVNTPTSQRKAYGSFRNEEEFWRLKSRSLWLKSGDRNTTYFHRQYRLRISRNHIAEITTTNGQACRGFEQIKEAAVNHFQNLLNAGKDGREEDMEEFLINIPQLVSLEDNESLIRPASEEEIINIAWSMEPDKSPRPDGFSIHFSRICWEIIKIDLMRMVQGFMRKAKVGGSINSTFLALIPKENNPGTFDRYRPISL
eukprot:PITA_30505